VGTGLVSPWHLAILALVLLLIFGPRRLPEMGRSLGHGIREFKNSVSALAEPSEDGHADAALAGKVAGAAGERPTPSSPREHDS